MKLALLQPHLAPNLHDLAAMLQADRIILQDTEKWSRKSRVHRARIRTDDGTQWINIPVRTEDKGNNINEVRIDHQQNWVEPLLRSLKFNYNNSIYYDFYEPEVESLFKSATEYEYLLPFVLQFQQTVFKMLELDLNYILASDVSNYTSDPDELVNRLGANQLFQEHDSRHYQRQAAMKTASIFHHPEYYQHFDGFEPNCCILDLIFQMGPESFRVTDQLMVNNE